MNLDQQTASKIDSGLTCQTCGETNGLYPQVMATGPHYARLVCANCDDRFVTWLRKPDTRPKRDGKSTRLLRIIHEAWADEPLYCLICLRDERTLPTGTWMEAHHVLEHTDAGADVAANLQPLCNECHSLVHWRRRTTHGEQIGKPETWEVEHAPS